MKEGYSPQERCRALRRTLRSFSIALVCVGLPLNALMLVVAFVFQGDAPVWLSTCSLVLSAVAAAAAVAWAACNIVFVVKLRRLKREIDAMPEEENGEGRAREE